MDLNAVLHLGVDLKKVFGVIEELLLIFSHLRHSSIFNLEFAGLINYRFRGSILGFDVTFDNLNNSLRDFVNLT